MRDEWHKVCYILLACDIRNRPTGVSTMAKWLWLNWWRSQDQSATERRDALWLRLLRSPAYRRMTGGAK